MIGAGPLRLPIRHLMTVAPAEGPDDQLITLGVGPGGSVVELRGKLKKPTPFVREAHLMSATMVDNSGSRRIALEQTRPVCYLSVQPQATGGLVAIDSRGPPWGQERGRLRSRRRGGHSIPGG